MSGPSARVWPPVSPAVPVVASLPHGGRIFPDAEVGKLAVRPDVLWSDWDTPRLYRFLPELGIATVENQLSRFVADPNRDLTPPLFGGFWRAAISATDTRDEPIYGEPLTDEEVRRRIELAHEPYHATLDRLLRASASSFDRTVLLDLHSFGRDLPADVVLGDGNGRTAAAAVVDRVEEAFAAQGFSVRRNLRFTGGWIVRRFSQAPQVDAVQIELNQRTYLERWDDGAKRETPTVDEVKFAQTQERLKAVMALIATTLSPSS
jgi:N-formylglutamate deformylase